MSEALARLSRVPCTIVTGFLGAGKTTLIRHVLANAQGRRLAVIVNEFGDVGIDGEILKACGNAACPEENIVELANGCICCTVADEFVPALDAILAREGVEHIVIETSGLALPKPLVQAFHWPAIKNRVTVDGVVVVVDGAALASGRVAQDLEALARRLKAWSIVPTGTEGYAKAEVTVGGVATEGLSSQTLEARNVPGLYVIGEAVDVTGWLGGYNFQWAWSSGWCAGQAA